MIGRNSDPKQEFDSYYDNIKRGLIVLIWLKMFRYCVFWKARGLCFPLYDDLFLSCECIYIYIYLQWLFHLRLIYFKIHADSGQFSLNMRETLLHLL